MICSLATAVIEHFKVSASGVGGPVPCVGSSAAAVLHSPKTLLRSGVWLGPLSMLMLILTAFDSLFRWASPRRSLLSDQLQRQLKDLCSAEPLQLGWRLYLWSTPLQQMLALEQRFFLADHNLRYTDAMSMAQVLRCECLFGSRSAGLELAPPRSLQATGQLRQMGVEARHGTMAAAGCEYRPKTGWCTSAPLVGRSAALLREFRSARLAADGLFHPSAVQQLLEDQRSGRRDATYTIWSIVCITLWWEQQRQAVYG